MLIGEIHFLPPVPGTCPLCGAKHEKGTPHDERSAYYRMRYHRKYGCWPEEAPERAEAEEDKAR